MISYQSDINDISFMNPTQPSAITTAPASRGSGHKMSTRSPASGTSACQISTNHRKFHGIYGIFIGLLMVYNILQHFTAFYNILQHFATIIYSNDFS